MKKEKKEKKDVKNEKRRQEESEELIIRKTDPDIKPAVKTEEPPKKGKKSKKRTPKGWRNKRIPTEGFSKGDKVQLIYQQLETSPHTDDYYTVNKILSLEHIEIDHQGTKRRLTVRGDKLRHHNHQPP